MPFFCLVMLDALALGLLLTMSELLSLVFASMGFTMRIQWYHHIHTLIMDYAFIPFICFVTYEERLMGPPCHHLNRSRLRSRSVPNEVSSSHLTRHQYTRLCSQNPQSCSIYRGDSHQCTWHCHRNFNYNHCTILCGNDCTHRNCTNHHCPDLFPPPTSYIDLLASHISFLSLASLTSSHLSASLEYYFTPLHTPAASPPSYVYSNCLPLPSPPRVPPGELADGEFLSNAMLSLEYKSITIHWREFSGQECARAHPNWHVLQRLCHDDQPSCLRSILRLDCSLPEGTSSF